MAAARRGDRAAMQRLLGSVSDTVYRYGQSFCRNPDDAQDVLQDVLVALMESLPRFRGESALSTWAFVVARRTCAKRRRREARFSSLEGEHGSAARDLPDPGVSPARELDRRRLRERLEQAIGALPDAQRDVLMLRDVEGRSAEEVARALKLGVRAVKSRLHRARVAVRRALATPPDGPPPRRSPGCPDTARMLSRFLEGELTPGTCDRLEAHVAGCDDCRSACDTLRAAVGGCRSWGEAPIPAAARTRVRAAIREAVARLSMPSNRGARRARTNGGAVEPRAPRE